MKTGLFVSIGVALAAWTIGCSSTSSPVAPSATDAAFVRQAKKQGATPAQLTMGREVFTTRCIDCHVLPDVAKYQPREWPPIVARMAKRAHLSASEHDAVVAYLSVAAAQAH